MPSVADVADFLERFTSLSTAAEWDNVGLLLGHRHNPVRKIMTCLTVTPETVAEACKQSADLIVTHHPILFKTGKKITDSTPEGRMLWDLARANISVFSPHTAFDNCDGGINDILAHRLHLTDVRPLRSHRDRPKCKITVFVPDEALAKVSDALFQAGAGGIGQYRECSFRLAGTGTFFGTEGTNPAVGKKGHREEVAEWRLETLCPESRVEDVVQAMRSAHPYEEPAFDVYSLRLMKLKTGEGRIGNLRKEQTLAELAECVRKNLGANFLHRCGEPNRRVRTVAIACGAAGEFWTDARREGADAFLTGEMRFHDLLAAQAGGMALLLPGHYTTERPGVEALVDHLKKEFPDIETWASQDERDPLQLA